MSRYTCRQCGKVYNYCRSCTLTPMPWKAAGFCSKECSAANKAPKIEIPEIINEPIQEEIVEVPANVVETEIKPKVKKRPKVIIEPDIEIETIFTNIVEQDGVHE